MDDGSKDVSFADLRKEEIDRSLEELFCFLPLLAFEELRACSYERIDESDAVLARSAPRRFDPAIRFPLA